MKPVDDDGRMPAATQYSVGFLLSLVLTFIPYLLVTRTDIQGWTFVAMLVAFAVAQLMIQVFFFLHLGSEKKPQWNMASFIFTAGVVFILVVGSMWIMANLDYNMSHDPVEIDQEIIKDEGY